MAAAPAEADQRKLAQQRFQRIYQDVLVGGEEQGKAAAQAIRLMQENAAAPKYFAGAAPRLEVVAQIDSLAARPDDDRGAVAKDLYGDFFLLCMAFKKNSGVASTAEDANFDAALVESFFKGMPDEAVMESRGELARLAEALVEQGCDELCASPPKLRALLPMILHPGLVEPDDEAFEALKKVHALVGKLHGDTAALEVLARWLADLPLSLLEQQVSQVQQFLTLSLLEAQAEMGSSSSLETLMLISRSGNLARHVRNALRTLDVCYRANELRRLRGEDWRRLRKAQLLRRRGELLQEDEAASGQFLPPTQFHNDAINECDGMLKHDLKEMLDLQQQGVQHIEKAEEAARCDFGIIEFPFVLTPVSKVRMLSIETMVIQRGEVRSAMTWQVLMRGGGRLNPYLVLKVRRTAVIEDALQQLAVHGSGQLKKPLKIVFDGEEGVDEGGVQKEFFQILVEELYNEDFGMFERIEESHNFWFNKNSFEVNLQFELFGIVLGLAIYNQVILDVKFPRAVYKKLMGDNDLALSDLMDFQPSLAQGLITLLEHEDPATFQETFGPLFFVVEYDCFGSMTEAELVEGGSEIVVSHENREDYVKRYVKWIFNTSVERQFGAFKKGFDQCMGSTLFKRLFTRDELELVICGSPELDFEALEKSAQYQDGFTATSDPIKWFWEVVHAMTEEEKRNLLAFCTGCDRAPVGGLGRLTFVVSRAGPDSDALPTVHTCFNHFLLPAYVSKEKLSERLRKAIEHCAGFGLM